MRHGWPTEQCLWLGPGGHRGRCRYTITNGNADSYRDSNSYAFGMRAVGHAKPNRFIDRNGYSHDSC